MDQHEYPGDQADDKGLFHPDETVVVGGGNNAEHVLSEPAQAPEAAAAAEVMPAANEEKPEHEPASSVTWTASEYITHSKSAGWYVALAAATVVIAVVTWLITRDFFPATMVAIALLLLGIYAGRKPREQSYALDSRGLTIGSRHYSFRDFRSFSVAREGAFPNIELTPLKRFAMYVTVYFDPKDEGKIARLLSAHLPMEEPRTTFTDSLMRQIKF